MNALATIFKNLATLFQRAVIVIVAAALFTALMSGFSMKHYHFQNFLAALLPFTLCALIFPWPRLGRRRPSEDKKQ